MVRRGRKPPTIAGRSDRQGDARTEPGWLDTVRNASDLALLGILTTIGALGVVTIGAAVATASASLHHWREHGHWPTAREIVHRYGRELLPGVPVTLLAVATACLLAVNGTLLWLGTVPGGAVLAWLTLVLALALVGYAALTVVEVGRDDAGWRAAARRAVELARNYPAVLAALAGVTAFACLLVWLIIPVAAPILVGYLLLAQHAVARRLTAPRA